MMTPERWQECWNDPKWIAVGNAIEARQRRHDHIADIAAGVIIGLAAGVIISLALGMWIIWWLR